MKVSVILRNCGNIISETRINKNSETPVWLHQSQTFLINPNRIISKNNLCFFVPRNFHFTQPRLSTSRISFGSFRIKKNSETSLSLHQPQSILINSTRIISKRKPSVFSFHEISTFRISFGSSRIKKNSEISLNLHQPQSFLIKPKPNYFQKKFPIFSFYEISTSPSHVSPLPVFTPHSSTLDPHSCIPWKAISPGKRRNRFSPEAVGRVSKHEVSQRTCVILIRYVNRRNIPA